MKKNTDLKALGISREIKEYVNTLLKTNIRPQEVILFGSFAKNKYHDYSDIDLAIVSNEFEKDPIEAMMNLSRLTIGISDRIESIALTSKDMKSKYHPFIAEIKKYGKVIYSS